MCNDQAVIEDLKKISDGWRGKCFDHVITLTTIAEMVNNSDEVEKSMELIKGILQEANFIPKPVTKE